MFGFERFVEVGTVNQGLMLLYAFLNIKSGG
jgi:hypothetical protein